MPHAALLNPCLPAPSPCISFTDGAAPEVRVAADGRPSLTKWRTLGRVSHESPLVMPDNRTIYIADGHPNGVLLRFVADRAGDLGAGALYAARFARQRDGGGRLTWDVSWVELGKGELGALNVRARLPPPPLVQTARYAWRDLGKWPCQKQKPPD